MDMFPKAQEWIIVPEPHFRRTTPRGSPEEDDPNICEQCIRIDFEAIFQIPIVPGSTEGLPVCSFSGLSRRVLSSRCPVCRTFATAVYSQLDPNARALLQSVMRYFDGNMFAFNTRARLGAVTEADHLLSQHRVMRVGLLIPPPFSRTTLSLDSFFPSYGKGRPYGYVRSLILPEEAKMIDYPTSRSMIAVCEGNHESCGLNQDIPFPENSRVIDCQNRRVVVMSRDIKYFTLSYVWGNKTNRGHMDVYDNIPRETSLLEVLPRTIEDAMKATLALGYEYLWIDYFCIDQSNPSDMMHQIRQMAGIYHHSSATICALGENPDVGLPGVSQPRPTSDSFRTQGTSFVHVGQSSSIQDTIQRSKWNTRGWTFQEAILSRRCLFFTDEQIWMVCQSGNSAETDLRTWNYRHYVPTRNIHQAITASKAENFFQYVNQYQKRDLTHDGDALDAFKGLLSLLPTQSYYGILLPPLFRYIKEEKIGYRFVCGLLWTVLPSQKLSERRNELPSWSWLGRKKTQFGSLLTNYYDLSDAKAQGTLSLGYTFSPFYAEVRVETPTGERIEIADVFRNYTRTNVVPERYRALEFRTFFMEYQVVGTHANGLPEYPVRMKSIESSPCPFKVQDKESTMYPNGNIIFSGNLFADAYKFGVESKEKRFAMLLLKQYDAGGSYWLALRLAYKANGRSYFHREGLISVDKPLIWDEGWEKVSRESIWLI